MAFPYPHEVAWRYVSGRPLFRDPAGYLYLEPGVGLLAGWQRQAVRVGLPAVAYAAHAWPAYSSAAASVLAAFGAWQIRRHLHSSRFDDEYTGPVLAAIRDSLPGVRVDLRIDRGLGTLTTRLARPASPAETAVRRWYGAHVEPVVRWPGDRVMRGRWAVQRAARPVTRRLQVFRRPVTAATGPRIELRIDAVYLTAEQRKLVSAIISSKIPVSDLVESWNLVGRQIVAIWAVRKRPPARVGYDQLVEAMAGLGDGEFFLGIGAAGQPVTVSLVDDSPHIAVSAGSGAGKSVLAQTVAVQVLARGGRVVILDRKGSHRALLGLPGVDYCTQPVQMHDALVKLAVLADERNTLALHEPEGWDPGQRILVICEEMNATIGQLTTYWADTRDKGQPRRSPAVSALADLLFMGRSAKVNVLAVAQMLTARAIGGPEARENFGVRCLARYTANAWKMLVPQAPMPRASRTLGRWQVVVGDQATEVQVAYLTAADTRRLLTTAPAESLSPKTSDSSLTSNVPGYRDTMQVVTLREAIDAGAILGKYEAVKKRVQRRVGDPPEPVGKRGQADLYSLQALAAWDDRVHGAAVPTEAA